MVACNKDALFGPFLFIGGTWYYTDEVRENQGPSVYQCLVSNTSIETSCFSDFPFPDGSSHYFDSGKAIQYLKDYASHFDLWKHIQLETEVLDVTRAGDYDQTGKWKVVSRRKNNKQQKIEIFDAVMVATGFFRKPIIPEFPGSSDFLGTIIHAKAYRKGSTYEGKSVLVIGKFDIPCI